MDWLKSLRAVCEKTGALSVRPLPSSLALLLRRNKKGLEEQTGREERNKWGGADTCGEHQWPKVWAHSGAVLAQVERT